MSQSTVTRRDFLRAGAVAGTGLTIALWLPGCSKPAASAGDTGAAGGTFEPNAFLTIGADDSVTIISKHMEMGQGAYTGMATLVAEELDADWSKVKVVGAPGDASKYGNALFGGIQGTGGSSSVAEAFTQMRQAGATARALLVAAAAATWNVPAAEVTVENGVVKHKGGKSARFGELVAKAAQLTPPKDVPLKDRAAFRYIGKDGLPRTDVLAKVTGTATFTQDVKLPGMLTAVVARAPRFGATVKSFDDAKAKAVKGVRAVVQVPGGVAVVADHFWAAKKGRDALTVEWDSAKAERRSSDAILAEYRGLAAKPGEKAGGRGDAAGALRGAKKTVEATYTFPYLAHASMEPLNCVAQVSAGGCELWYGAQIHTGDQMAVAGVLGIKPEQVKVNSLYAGGSFGRRAAKGSDYVLEAVHIAKALGTGAPVKLVWTREDDMRAGNYRPAMLHVARAGLGADGKPVAWVHTVVGQGAIAGSGFAPPKGPDPSSSEGISDLAYAVPNLSVQVHDAKSPVPVQWWRSVGHTHTAFAKECFVDECAHAAGQDPVAYRLALLGSEPRHAGVLKLAAEKAGWGTPLPAGRARGVAVHQSFNTYVAEVAEVSKRPDGSLKVERVVCAVDCGVAVNPDVIRAQMESGIAYGLGAMLHGAITLKDGVVQQANFDTFPSLRLTEMPVVEVHIVPSDEKPTGVGEPGLPPLAPAVANAWYALTGTRIRDLPFKGA